MASTTDTDPFLPLTEAARFIGTDERPASIYGLRAAIKRLGIGERNELGHLGVRRSVAEQLRANRQAFGYWAPKGVTALALPPVRAGRG